MIYRKQKKLFKGFPLIVIKNNIRGDNPTPSDVHVNRPLTNIAVAFMQDQQNFVAGRFFPTIPVSKQSDQYYTYNRADWNRDEMKVRAPSTETEGGGYRLSTDSYRCEVLGFHKDIDDRVRSNEDDPLDSDRDATEFVARKGLIKREVRFQSNYFTTGLWTTDVEGQAASPDRTNNEILQWNDTNSTPIADVKKYKRTVHLLTGFMPNKMIIGQQVWDELSEHPDIIDRLNRTSSPGSPAIVNLQAVTALFELEEIMIASAIQNTAEEDSAGTESNSYILGNHALLGYVPPRPGILVPSAGYTFVWDKYLGRAGGSRNTDGMRVKKFRMENISSDRIEGEIADDPKLVSADLGVFFNNVVESDSGQSV